MCIKKNDNSPITPIINEILDNLFILNKYSKKQKTPKYKQGGFKPKKLNY